MDNYYTIHDLPLNIRPRERLKMNGAESLSDYELLAIILRTGTKDLSVLDLSKQLLIKYNELNSFTDLTINELMSNKGIKEVKAIEILACVEFGKRVCVYTQNKTKIQSSLDLYNKIRYEMENLTYEEIRAYYLDIRGQIKDYKLISKGNNNSSTCDPREIIKWALKLSTYNLILVHNHPSGDPTPSHHDSLFTSSLAEYCHNMNVNLLDHIIIGKNKYYTYKTKKMIEV